MDVERIIDDIEQLQEMFEAPDIRPLSASDISAANRRHDETFAHSPWFKLWQCYGVCCQRGVHFRLREKVWISLSGCHRTGRRAKNGGVQ